MIVLDTNVISELMRSVPTVGVLDWMDRQVSNELCLTAVTVAELLYGVARLPDGRRKRLLAEQIDAMLNDDFDHRVVAFDETAAGHYADIAARREQKGRPISSTDAQIAAICRSHAALLATRNVSDFLETGITVVNPWTVGS